MSRQHYRSGGGTGGRREQPPRYTEVDTDSAEEEGQRLDNVSQQQTREQLVFDKDSGKLVVRDEKPRVLASKTVLTGIASSGFFSDYRTYTMSIVILDDLSKTEACISTYRYLVTVLLLAAASMSQKQRGNKKRSECAKVGADNYESRVKEIKEFKVFIYKSEYRQIQAWVDKYQHLETGGDLFGLWADDHTAVVQLVLGPGERCKRTTASFYQDVEYLDRVGYLLTHEEGLCHIGEWHSHHRLGLSRPSGGDENTVWNNMNNYGIYRFCLFIATIGSSWSHKGSLSRDDVDVNGFLFQIPHTKNQHYSIPWEGKFEMIYKQSPFRSKYSEEICKGAESLNREEDLQAHEKHRNTGKADADYQTYVPVEKKLKNVGEGAAYQALELTDILGSDEPEADTKQKSEIYWFWKYIHDICCYLCWFT